MRAYGGLWTQRLTGEWKTGAVRNHRRHSARGLSLVELLVVLAVLTLLAAISVPAFVRFRPQDEVNGARRELYTMLKHAQVHAVSQRVKTAVVYVLDNYTSPLSPPANVPPEAWTTRYDPANESPLAEPVTDSLSGDNVRVGVAYALVYEIKDGPFAGFFVPAEEFEGNFRAFPGRSALLFAEPTPGLRPRYYDSTRPRFQPTESDSARQDGYANRIQVLGMSTVPVLLLGRDERQEVIRQAQQAGATPSVEGLPVVQFPGHVFRPPSGSLFIDGGSTAERFTIHLALRPSEPVEDRFTDAGVLNQGLSPQELRTLPLQLYRSTGRVRVVE